MKKHISTIIAILVFVTGLSLLLYPTVSNYWNSKHQTAVVANYSEKIEKMDDQDRQAAIDAAAAYNETLLSNAGRFTPDASELSLYKSLLNADGTGMMGYITIPEVLRFLLVVVVRIVLFLVIEGFRVLVCLRILIVLKRGIYFICMCMARFWRMRWIRFRL